MPTGHARTAALLRSDIPETCPSGEDTSLWSAAPRRSGLLSRGRLQGTGRQPACPGRACPRIEHLASGPGGVALNQEKKL
jgi:hypothetical protein